MYKGMSRIPKRTRKPETNKSKKNLNVSDLVQIKKIIENQDYMTKEEIIKTLILIQEEEKNIKVPKSKIIKRGTYLRNNRNLNIDKMIGITGCKVDRSIRLRLKPNKKDKKKVKLNNFEHKTLKED